MTMRLALTLLLAMVLTPIAAVPATHAQDAAVYVVSYVDVAPANRGTAASLLRQLATASRKDEGNTRFEILQRTAPSNQFAIVSAWKDQKAYDTHLAAAHTKEFRDKVKPYLISAIDDRTHTGMEIAGGTAAKSGPGTIYVVTHVDVPPPKKDDCIAALKSLVAASRKEPGSVRFDIFQQGSRPNHFSVVEIWKGQGAYDAHITAADTKKFRDELTPMSGALYDERLYKAI
jgi:quinol monooxygenase YgiN